ncbi:16193_t:CDS:2, partial [Gigaspora margarita]
MKFLLYNLVFTIILLTILPTELTQNVQNVPLPLNNNNFTQHFLTSSIITHSEISIQPNLTGAQSRILHIDHYHDSPTTVVRIARENYVSDGRVRCFERRLLLRVIQANGTIIEINFDNIEEIQDINYCLVYNPIPKQPINVYPLFEQYILVTYTHATNTSDNTTFTDRGLVLDWGGNIISKLDFGPSYLAPGTNWYPNEYIVNNITPKKGFLRLSTINVNRVGILVWRQYGYNGNGIFSLLSNDIVPNLNPGGSSFQITVFPTLNDGYAIVYANSTNNVATSDPLTAQFIAKAGIYAILLTYNQTKTSERIILHEMNTPNITFTALRCSIDYVSIGGSCIVYVQQIVQETTNFTFYIRIRFLSSGSVMTLSTIFNLSIANIITMPLGGYITILRSPIDQNINFSFVLYDENNKLSDWVYPHQSILANLYGAFDITGNNLLLIAQNETTTFWSLLSIKLPPLSLLKDSGYDNLHVVTTYPQIHTTNLILSTNVINITFLDQISLSDGNLNINQIINQTNILRQRINSRTCDNNKCYISNNTVILEVFTSTFNDPGGKYFIQMDNNFVRSFAYNEPMLGIEQYKWTFQTGDLSGKVLLTISGTIFFKELNDSGRNEFFTLLIRELTFRIPVEPERLSTNGHYQTYNLWSDSEQILIPIFIKEARNNNEQLAANVRTNLNILVKQKQYTGIGTGTVTSLLDENYGFQQVVNQTLRFETKFNNNVTLNLIITTFNLTLAFSILFSEHSKEFAEWFAQHRRTATTVSLISGAYIDMLLILKSRLLKLKVFDAPLSNKSLTIIFWGACADIFVGDIPQLIIQHQVFQHFPMCLVNYSLSNSINFHLIIRRKDQSDNSDDLGKSNLEEPYVDRSVEQRENSGEPVEQRENPEQLNLIRK